MSKSKSHPCRHPRTAVTGIGLDDSKERIVYECKKCNGTFHERVPTFFSTNVDVDEWAYGSGPETLAGNEDL